MAISAAILAAIVAHIGFAVSDSISIYANRRLGVFRMALLSPLVTLVYIFLLFGVLHSPFVHVTATSALQTTGLAVVLFAGFVLFNKSLTSPLAVFNGVIAGAFPAIVVPLSMLFYDATLTSMQLLFVVVTLSGMLAGSLPPGFFSRNKATRFNRDLLYGLGACLCWGLYFTFIRTPLGVQGWYATEALVISTQLIIIVIVGLLLKRQFSFKGVERKTLLASLAAVTGTFVALLTYYYAIEHGNQAVVTPIAGSYPALFAVLSFWLYRDRLSQLQMIGLVVTLTGIIGLTLA